MNLYLHLNLDIPTHTTVLNWTKKQGISQFRTKEFYQREKWVLILDESIQFGNKKLLLVVAVPEHRCRHGNALSYRDLTPLVLQVSDSWKSEDIVPVIKQHIDLTQIAYCISDNGNNLTCAIKSLKCKHIQDINHMFSLIIQSVFGKNTLFNDYTKALSLLRAQKSMSKIARIVPPNQRIMSRFMNLTPLFEWGMKMLHLLDTNQLTDHEKMVLSFLETFREFIFDTYQILIRLNNMQKILKDKGFNVESAKEVRKEFSDMKSDNALKVNIQLDKYLIDLTSKAAGETICCSSDVIESCFGKYKEVVKGNKSVGITDLCLYMVSMMGKNSSEKTQKAMETVNIKQLKEWKIKNVPKTLFAEKTDINKKIDRTYFYKK